MRSVFPPLLQSLRRCLHRWLVLLLLAAVPLYGTSGVLLSVVGPAHRHVQVQSPVPPSHEDRGDWLQQGLRSLIGDKAAALLATAQLQVSLHDESVPHHHGLFEHHHHAAGDASVELLGASDASVMVDLAAVGSAMLPFLPVGVHAVPAPQGRHLAWPTAVLAAWANAVPMPLERPPHA